MRLVTAHTRRKLFCLPFLFCGFSLCAAHMKYIYLQFILTRLENESRILLKADLHDAALSPAMYLVNKPLT